MLRTHLLLPDENGGPANVIRGMRACEDVRRRAARDLLRSRLYMAFLIVVTIVFLVTAIVVRTPTQIGMLGAYGLLTGFMFGHIPWKPMRANASQREAWFAMSTMLLAEAGRRADGMERITIGALSARLHHGLDIAPTSRTMRMQHLSDAADVMESITDPAVLEMLVAHVRLAAAGMGVDLTTREAVA